MPLKAHDVRRMRTCQVCDELGMVNVHLDDPLPLLIHTPSGRLVHPACISEPLLLTCAEAELVCMRVADVGRELFERVLDELIRRRNGQ